MARKKKERVYRTKDRTGKVYGMDKENERKQYYIEVWPEAFVFHIRGSLGGLFDLVAIGENVVFVEPISPSLSFPANRLEVSLIEIKAGSAAYIQTERRKFKKHCDRLPILTGLHYLFDSTVRGSGVWTSESYPGDFETKEE